MKQRFFVAVKIKEKESSLGMRRAKIENFTNFLHCFASFSPSSIRERFKIPQISFDLYSILTLLLLWSSTKSFVDDLRKLFLGRTDGWAGDEKNKVFPFIHFQFGSFRLTEKPIDPKPKNNNITSILSLQCEYDNFDKCLGLLDAFIKWQVVRGVKAFIECELQIVDVWRNF